LRLEGGGPRIPAAIKDRKATGGGQGQRSSLKPLKPLKPLDTRLGAPILKGCVKHLRLVPACTVVPTVSGFRASARLWALSMLCRRRPSVP
jgi:hypothetical protein